MAYEVVMPQMGESIAEGTVTTWLKKVGDPIAQDEALLEISTDKVDAEIPSPVRGFLQEIKVEAGQTVPIHTVIALIRLEDGAQKEPPAPSSQDASPPSPSPAPTPVSASAAPVPPPQAPPPASASSPASSPTSSIEERRRVKSSPLVRKIAAEHQVDVRHIQGTGLSGRVTKQDILSYLEQAPPPASALPPPASMNFVGDAMGPLPAAYRPQVLEGDRVEELSPMRAKIAEHMVLSKRISPHVGTVWEVDFTRVASLRAQHKATWEARFGVNLTFTAFIMKATVDALKAFPMLNASLEDTKAIYHRDVHLGLAVALDWGLIVPVIHRADELNTLGLARRAADLAQRARIKKLKPEEVRLGTFTISNAGLFGPMFNLPVINQPQVGILGVGTVEKRPVVIDGMIAIRTRAYVSLSFDHRLVDGADAERFMGRIKQSLENFEEGDL